MNHFERCAIRDMSRADLPAALRWRNHPEVRLHMLTQHEISVQEHERWFDACTADAGRRLLVLEDGGEPIGFVNFSGVAPGGVADWGFYAVPGAAAGRGTRICATALDFAFRELLLHKVCGQALASNARSIHLHRKLGFQQEGVLRQQHRVGAAYHDLICFGLLRGEWP